MYRLIHHGYAGLPSKEAWLPEKTTTITIPWSPSKLKIQAGVGVGGPFVPHNAVYDQRASHDRFSIVLRLGFGRWTGFRMRRSPVQPALRAQAKAHVGVLSEPTQLLAPRARPSLDERSAQRLEIPKLLASAQTAR